MRKRVGIARATIADPKIVIYDEPSAGLAPVTTSKICDRLTEIQARSGGTVLAISSDVTAIRDFVDRIAMMYEGQIVSTVEANEVTREELGLLMAGAQIEGKSNSAGAPQSDLKGGVTVD